MERSSNITFITVNSKQSLPIMVRIIKRRDSSSYSYIYSYILIHILGVNRSTNNILCRAELGRYPINIHINSKIINFYKHVKSKPNETIVHQAYLLDKQLSQRYIETGTLQQHITNFCHIYPRILPLSKRLKKH